jgi:hypothetical protein
MCCNAAMTGMPPMKGAIGFNGWRSVEQSRKAGYFIPETHAECGWDKLLSEMELTEEQASMAVACGDVLGQKLRSFARRVCQQRYVPEDVLSILKLTQSSGEGSLAIQSLNDVEGLTTTDSGEPDPHCA